MEDSRPEISWRVPGASTSSRSPPRAFATCSRHDRAPGLPEAPHPTGRDDRGDDRDHRQPESHIEKPMVRSQFGRANGLTDGEGEEYCRPRVASPWEVGL